MEDTDVAYVHESCGEAFAPLNAADWKVLKRLHTEDCGAGRYIKTTVGKAF